MTRHLPAVFALAGIGLAASPTASRQGAAPGARSAIFLSDLSLGVGRTAAGEWHPFEDFRQPSAFEAFLNAIDQEGNGATDLILNGDTFELLQSTRGGCVGPDPALGCTEAEALSRLERVLAAHDTEIRSLGQFSRRQSNHVVFVPGDHDAALLFPAVARRLIAAIDAPRGRVEIAMTGSWQSADLRVRAEHGHQVGFDPHKFPAWPAPFVDRNGRRYLARPWGEQVIQDYFNRYEEQYPIIDNVADKGLGVKYALAAEGVTDAGASTPGLLRYFLLKMSYAQFRLTDYTEGEPPAYDLAGIRAVGPEFLVGSLSGGDPFKPLAALASAAGRLSNVMGEMSDGELIAICDYHRGAVRRAMRRMEQGLSQFSLEGGIVAECPRLATTRGPGFEYFWRSRDVMFRRHLDAVTSHGSGDIDVFVHGHVGVPDRSQALYNQMVPQGFTPVRGAARPVVINGGGWQPTITPRELERRRVDAASYRDLLRSLEPEQLSPCYGFVHVPPYTSSPAPVVRYWRQSPKGSWEAAAACGGV